jgi:glyoxylase-like metal-dependent hydrolase (beta-lactamase superfamily II)
VRVSEWLALGHVIDLGGTRLEIIHAPRHSPDSVSPLARDANILFAADCTYPGPLYVQVLGSDLENYLVAARNLLSQLNEQTRILRAHGKPRCDGLHQAPVMQQSDIADVTSKL